jgi:hypothetical protein
MTDYPTEQLNPESIQVGVPPRPPWHRRKWTIAIAGVAVAAVVAGAAIAVVDAVGRQYAKTVTADTSHQAAILTWWSGAHDDFTALQTAVDDSKRAASRNDDTAMYAACQQIHDTAEVSLQGKMPTPDAELTAHVRAMIEDFHLASHMCLSALSGSTNQYAFEYLAYVGQAQRQMRAAQDLINMSMTKT